MRSQWVTALRVGVMGLSLAGLSAGCDEVVDVENVAPTVEVQGWCVEDDRTYLVLDVVDREEAPIDLVLCVQDSRVASGGAGSGMSGLRTERTSPGARHRVEWSLEFADDAVCGCGGGAGTCAAPPTMGAVALTVFADDGAGLRSLGEVTAEPLPTCAP